MAFPRPKNALPNDVGWVTHHFATHKNGTVVATVDIELLDADGVPVGERVHDDLLPHLTLAQRTTLVGVATEIRAKAASELIGAPAAKRARAWKEKKDEAPKAATKRAKRAKK